MSWGIIGTWRMALEGIEEAEGLLKNGESSIDAIELAIKMVEDHPEYRSVGYGGLPNQDCEVELDAAFMDGDNLSIGAVGGIKDFKNPISIARKLMDEKYNIFLVGKGAEKYAHNMGFERMNMLTDYSKKEWEKKKNEIKLDKLKAYDGHDTVGVVGLDKNGKMAAATSTSGLFMKKPGRIGDSPLSGSGFYADSEIGAASATGVGEDIMKVCISYEIVRLMEEGLHPKDAAEKAVNKLNKKLISKRGKAKDISVVCMNNKGQWGVATNINKFSFVVATETEKPTVYIASFNEGKTTYVKATQEWIDTHTE
ncbi:N(4)-(beta-N-acetylglucosaminyl)-L-asparaginase [Tissierella sp. MB52-C2]|uniref:N(4)-(beta-N-acetylglucosaminyl)-L-asparaginase n=1 Tax=Tissierella sp. MB52-C2 TaxID=3070999 RepID=UPI00280A6349|nr:N(4)-(beta-N-acetylglucosaminyl)-L-asparaginase [Tissierella sp. MB52-C2]WMM25481.1 N(4)-(beta-N-acetylglucosaminyl)-L-asparaginase [Tissierella sp. MB52-C2]